MSEEEIVSRVIATVLFEAFLFIGGGVSAILASKPVATAISAIFLMVAGVLQVTFIAEFSLKFIGVISLLILSWVAVISIVFGALMLVFSIISLARRPRKDHINVVPQQNGAIYDFYGEIRELKVLLDDGVITQEEFDEKKKQLLGL